ncbi:TetR/AcrR family transcriptional regulator [Mucilaginibacter sp. Bleaf8]|uniref:TetR/AcrR family transcriptional regulator n=1 Tax=Mucilaginibacter sp. Bleaf8 TaxID=2834430 RepID=UPI001BCBCBA4|nr:TetR/AcrR family transcriptional regulator [Mucilaginibacter sp. Bleaf8]MBS7563830.1 TetR/AcrR family transcriptional regulator [Mucilaginibacter sp. Bleaf8]
MDKKEERLKHILQATISILSKEGAENLSMRKVAKVANLTLSNLQYYYRDKDLLLIATVKYYFESCKEEVTHAINLLTAESTPSTEVFLVKLLNMLLIEGKSSDQILMFQEIWTLAARNKELEKAVETYYKTYCLWLIDLISMFSKEPEAIVSLLVPFVEGYTIVNNVVPLNKESIIQMIVKLILSMGK